MDKWHGRDFYELMRAILLRYAVSKEIGGNYSQDYPLQYESWGIRDFFIFITSATGCSVKKYKWFKLECAPNFSFRAGKSIDVSNLIIVEQ